MKKVLICSIQPEHVLNFLNGLKTIEVRKRDLPQWAKDKIDRGEVVQGYGFCTKGGKRLSVVHDDEDGKTRYYINSNWGRSLNGDVVFKFQVSGCDCYVYDGFFLGKYFDDTITLVNDDYELPMKDICLTTEQLNNYGKGKDLYAHHFTNIQPIEPMELREFYKLEPEIMYNNEEGVSFKHGGYVYIPLTKAPQSFMTAWVKGE